MLALSLNKPAISGSVAETEELASIFLKMIAPHAVVGLYGPLGAGKTCFVRGMARAAGVDPDDVRSPTFTLINEYIGGDIPIYHIDLYRISSAAEYESLGADDYFIRDGIFLIEWAENAEGYIPRDRYNIRFEIIDADARRLTFTRSRS